MGRRMAIPILLAFCAAVPLCGEEQWRSAVAAAEEAKREGRLGDAERWLRSALEDARRLEPDLAPAATVYNNLAGVYQDMGRYDQAVQAYQRSIDLWQKLGAAGETYLLRTANHLVGLYLECRAPQDAERHHRALVAPLIETRAGRARDPDVSQAIANLGSIEFEKHRYRIARAQFEEALAILDRASAAPPGEMAVLQNNLAMSLLHTGEAEAAVALSRRSIAMLEASGPAGPLLISTLANGANMCLIAHHREEAEALFGRALAMARGTLGEEHPLTAAVMSRYAAFLKAGPRKQEGAVLESRAREIRLRLTHSARETVDVRELSRK
jgi:tetratricopeptide (TPR) repeat protein